MFIKKYLAPLGAVAVFAAMTLALVAGGRTAEAATVTTRADAATVTTSASGTPVTLAVTFAANELDANGENFTITLPPGFVFTAAPTVTLANAAGMTAITCALGNSGQADGANNDLATCTATGGNTGTPTATISMNVRYTGAQTNLTNALLNGGTGSGNIQIGAGTGGVTAIADAGTLQVAYVSAGTIVVTTSPAVTSLPADGSSTVLLQATVTDAGGTRVANRAVNWTVSLGIVGTGTAKTITSFTNSNGVATTNYRGGGGVEGTDTVVATVTALNAVGTRAISLVAATGTTASKITFNAPTQMAVAATVTNTSPGYISPTTGTNVSVKVADAAGLGVNGQVLLVTTDKGFLVNGFGGACPGNTRAVSPTSATLSPTVGATAESGVVQLTWCGSQGDTPGQATITAQNVSTSMANATQAIAMSGRPATITATVTGTSITAQVKDAGGNAVADGTPVRFTMSQNAGAVSTGCTTSSNGRASSVVAPIQATATVIVTADYNETGVAATCAAAGTQQVSTSVTVQTGTVTPTPTPGTGAGTFASTPVFSTSGLAQVVFNGGSVTQLDAALAAVNANGAWAQD
ncbi:MAG: Ig-like domain-containing protein, partial [Chloroflexi bacterium]|nr:Ig-like domain-containing protein [Chloroflexota bacterium]